MPRAGRGGKALVTL